ncbi:uncharacterized protein LOC131844933 [Achroia grisella]|uniref:uncharacterized protein LOC131844933 n=1 Tax=Achroia grisella TaxID=688607 RepID=UPI0027D23E01|nr:uncharacterized protein LOC131844933 [Achroia grisella]
MESLHNTMAQMMEHFNKKMMEFQTDLQKAKSEPASISSLESNFKTFQSFTISALTTLQQQVELVTQKQDHLEMHSRQKILLLHGIPESQRESVPQVVSKVIADRLEIDGFSTDQIRRCRRLGQSLKDKPRPIIVKFHDLDVRNEVWHSKTKLKSSGITMSEFLTASRHSAFMSARQHFGVKKCWTHNGFIVIITDDGSRHRVSCIAEVNKLIDSSPSVTQASPVATSSKQPAAGNSRSKRAKK